MLQTVKVEVNVDGSVRLLEPLQISKKSSAILTVLDEAPDVKPVKGTVAGMLALLNSPEFANRKSYSAEEIDAQIQENRNSWE